MRRIAAAFVGLAAFCAAEAMAQNRCEDLRSIITAARTEFVDFVGDPLPDAPVPDFAVFMGTQTFTGAGSCALAQQTSAGRRFSTSYTCASVGPDTEQGLEALRRGIAACLDVTVWVHQQQPDGRGPWIAQFGLIRLSVTRHGPRGLALGVEVFRDERGEVMGSNTRGNSIGPDGGPTCRARTIGEIAASIRRYSELPGAERFEDENFLGYTNRTSEVAVAFVTRPVHPAHPAIIVRRITVRDGSTFISAEGDFAGDCQAFKDLLRQTDQMNRSLRPQ
jgi:hypothetical protein